MKTKIFHSFGGETINDYDFDLGEMRPDQILIKTKYTGICRSDIDQYTGKIEIPYGCFGHESVGEVISVGADITEFKVGDFVASRDDLAYSPYFYATEPNTTRVPELSTKYIIEPVACSVNIANQILYFWNHHADMTRILIVGSGFVSNLAAQYLKHIMPKLSIHVIGNHNEEQWNRIGAKFVTFDTCDTYDVILELSGKQENYELVTNVANDNAHIYLAASFNQSVHTTFWKPLWKNLQYSFPSPRSKSFPIIMKRTPELIEQGVLDVDWVWTNAYDATDYKQAFAESLHRNGDSNFIRSFLVWND